jgi:hypothetical protein
MNIATGEGASLVSNAADAPNGAAARRKASWDKPPRTVKFELRGTRRNRALASSSQSIAAGCGPTRAHPGRRRAVRMTANGCTAGR